jgi:low temperature requirement protein LtrA
MTLERIVCAPRLWSASPQPFRRVTWLELFFDLIFVAAVAEVGGPLEGDYSVAGLVRYSFLFVLIWWAWSGHTLYCTRFDHNDVVQRCLILVQCFIAAVMAANASDALDSRSSAGFGAAYGAMRLVLAVQYLRARRVQETRPLASRYGLGFGVAALVWLASSLLDAPARYWVWGLALAVDFATPWLAAAHSRRFPPDAAHFPERFGLFTIILLGEFVAAVMRGIESQEEWTFPAAATAFCGMAFAFVLRWWYFDVAECAAERHIRGRRQARWFEIWHYAHLPLFLGIAVAGVGFQRAIEGHDGTGILFAAYTTLSLAVVTMGASRSRGAKPLWYGWAIALLAGAACYGAGLIGRVPMAAALVGTCLAQGWSAGRMRPRVTAAAIEMRTRVQTLPESERDRKQRPVRECGPLG